MEHWLLVLGCAMAFAVLNRLRGMKNYLVWAPAASLAALVFFLGASPIWSVVVGLAFVLGENFGWTKWINCIPLTLTQKQYNRSKWLLDDTGKNDGSYWLAELIADERKNYKRHVIVGMTIRGLYWWVPVSVAMYFAGMASPLVAVMFTAAAAVAFPLCYHLASRFMPSTGLLKKAEPLYGFVYGAAIGLVVF